MASSGEERRKRSQRDRERYELEGQLESMLGRSALTRRQALVRGGGGLVVLSGIGSVLAACGSSDGGGGGGQPGGAITSKDWTPAQVRKKYGSTTIGDSWHSLQLAIIADRARGGTLAAKALGQRYRGISADLDPVKQISTVQNAFNSGLKAMNSVPLDATNVPPIDRAAKSVGGKYTTSYNTPPWKTPEEYGPEYVTYFSPDDFHIGELMAENLAEHIGGKGTIVVIRGLAGATADILRTKGIESVLKRYPDIKVGAKVNTDWTSVTAQKKMQTLLSSVGQIDGVIGNDDDLGIGAHSAIRAAGKEIPIVSCDGLKQAFELIAGSFYLGTVNTFTHWLGGYGTVRMFDALNGWKPNSPETMMFWQTGFIGKDRAKQYIKTFFGSTLPYDFAKMSQVLYPEDWDPQQQLRAIDPNYLWQTFPKPSGYKLPAGFSKDQIDATTAKYDKQWKNRNEFSAT